MPTLLITIDYRAAFGSLQERNLVEYSDNNFSERAGWREIVTDNNARRSLFGEPATDRSLPTHHHDHSHDHHHHHHDGTDHDHSHHGHSHHIENITWGNLLALGVSGGIVLCPSALVVLLSAITLHRIGFGLILIVAFSFGLASVLISIGLLMLYARRFMDRFNFEGGLVKRLPIFSAAVISVLGLVIAVKSVFPLGDCSG